MLEERWRRRMLKGWRGDGRGGERGRYEKGIKGMMDLLGSGQNAPLIIIPYSILRSSRRCRIHEEAGDG